MHKHYAFTPFRIEEDDSGSFQRFHHLMTGILTHRQIVSGFETFERGQRNKGLVGKRLLGPIEKRASGPHLAGSDHARSRSRASSYAP